MKITLAQISPKLKKCTKEEFADTLNSIDIKDSDLVVFPELSLNGYMLQDAVFEDAFEIEELEEFGVYSKNIDIALGAVTKEDSSYYNSAIYFSKGRIQKIHHKTSLPNYGLFQEARFFFKGKESGEFETKFGKTFLVICEELYDVSTIAKIANSKPDLVIVISNSPARGFEDEGLLIQKQWYSLLSSTAILSGANVAFVNRVGFEDGLGFWGGSCFVSPRGEILKEAKLFESDSISQELDKKLSSTQKYLLRGYK